MLFFRKNKKNTNSQTDENIMPRYAFLDGIRRFYHHLESYNPLEGINYVFGHLFVLYFVVYICLPDEMYQGNFSFFFWPFITYVILAVINAVVLFFDLGKNTRSLVVLSQLDTLVTSFLGVFILVILSHLNQLDQTVHIIKNKELIEWMAWIGLSYWLPYLIIWFFRPVLRDWILVKGRVIRRIVLGVLLSPFSVALLCGWLNDDIQADELFADKSVVATADDSNSLTTNSSDSESTINNPSLLLHVYYHFIDPGNQTDAQSHRGKVWAAVISFLGIILLNGLLVTTLINWFDRRREGNQNGSNYYKHPFLFSRKSKYVIIGGNEMSFGIVKGIFKKDPTAYIIIQTSNDVDDFRRRLYSTLTLNQCLNVLIYYGNRTSQQDIKKLKLETAVELYILGEEVEEDNKGSYHDTLNMKCLELVADSYYAKELLTCYVMFEFQSTFSIFQFSELSSKIAKKLKFYPFNGYEMWSQRVLICKSLLNYDSCYYLPLEGKEGITSDSNEFVHLVIVGMSRMGVALALETAHLAHYPNFVSLHSNARSIDSSAKKKRTRITFIDSQMDQEIDFFKGRFDALFSLSRTRYVDSTQVQESKETPCIYSDDEADWKISPSVLTHNPNHSEGMEHLGGDFLDIEWEFIKGSVAEPVIQRYLQDAAENVLSKVTVAICIPESNQAIASAIYLPSKIFENKNVIQVLVLQRTNNSLLKNIDSESSCAPYYGKLKGFGMLSETFDSSLIEQSLNIAYDINNKYGDIDDDIYGLYQKKAWEICRIMDGHSVISYEPSVHSNGEYDAHKDLEFVNRCISEQRKRAEKILSELKGTEQGIEVHLSGVEKVKGKTPVSKLWSNIYNGNTLWTKIRCIQLTDSQRRSRSHFIKTYVNDEEKKKVTGAKLDEKIVTFLQDFHLNEQQLYYLAEVEHNRWNMEQLLMLYRPLNRFEQYTVLKEFSLYLQAEIKINELKFQMYQEYKKLMKEGVIQNAANGEHVSKSSTYSNRQIKLTLEELYKSKKDAPEPFKTILEEIAVQKKEQKGFNEIKNQMKGRMAHPNICSSAVLRDIDYTYRQDIGLCDRLFEVFINEYAVEIIREEILVQRRGQK